jgi:hypothetical protein
MQEFKKKGCKEPTHYYEEIFKFLESAGEVGAEQIARHVGLPRAYCSQLLYKMAGKGLAIKTCGRPLKFCAGTRNAPTMSLEKFMLAQISRN